MSNRTADQLFTDEAPCCSMTNIHGCACGPQERALRAICNSEYRPMTEAERNWCKAEILSVEGYDEKDAEGDDQKLAQNVLSAWTDYCRDKGMI